MFFVFGLDLFSQIIPAALPARISNLFLKLWDCPGEILMDVSISFVLRTRLFCKKEKGRKK